MTLDQVAAEAGTSRPLLHTYFGDRRGLLDAVQIRIVSRFDAWTAHGLNRADNPLAVVRALTDGVISFVTHEPDSWSVLVASGGLDHPLMHRLCLRWSSLIDDPSPGPSAATAEGDGPRGLTGELVVHALLGGAGGWVRAGVDAADIADRLVLLLAHRAI